MMIYYRTVRLGDTDAAGVVYFATALSICHEAYEASLEQAYINLRKFFNDPEQAIPIVHGEIDFFRPLFCGEKLEIHLLARQLKDSEFEIEYQIFKGSSEGEKAARALTRHVCINPISRQRSRLPDLMVQWLARINTTESERLY
ncbi:thioesterase superfamily protein [Gloeothece citriformis PCC 7424]|uniref:1,4-dihydroxy-2-naphthoyl-CoA hydrolase n=1 Tax=Gloeothece citriformis (strain PCC 7424) TaxID=65393 RepID=DNCH_GLOC7|nr:thioesterase family protein [Gloeothece citriformis]B7KDA3.1 RecName: Full=1,4-dihydroxy-2-naphthoyl-CoA hydrolase; Short=DHNA-CoA hydrolase; AltName: Full=DHNA-CoA thioesterase [Gloeothece citriformis PCC 7424]ACK68923.1 thioesterase superfamily protein [Gloeothece citriformis PCC 7424]